MHRRPIGRSRPPATAGARALATLLALGLAWLLAGCGGGREEPPELGLRLALFNIRELSRAKLDDVAADGRGRDPQLLAAAEIVARVRPDVLVLQEIDLPAEDVLERNAELFVQRYLEPMAPDHGLEHAFAAPSNTGVLSGHDLDGDGVVAGPDDLGTRVYGGDALGFGVYPGQYAMAVVSRWPFDRNGFRSFRRLLWRDLPGNHLPEGFYEPAELEALPLSSKSHWDLPVATPAGSFRLWISHPTPPVFDGPEDRNGRRNFDEIGFWARYLDGAVFRDDQGRAAGGGDGAPFVIVGDLNARPQQTESIYDGRNAIAQLLEHDEVRDTGAWLTSRGALAGREAGPPDHWERATAGFLGGSRVDYLLPGPRWTVVQGGVFWPDPEDDAAGAALAAQASDHRLLWLDLVKEDPVPD